MGGLETFFNQNFPSFSLPPLVTCPVVAHMLRECVIEVAKEQGQDVFSSIVEFAKIGLDVMPRIENREGPGEGSICLEVINTFHDRVFVPLVRSEQVDLELDPDKNNGDDGECFETDQKYSSQS